MRAFNVLSVLYTHYTANNDKSYLCNLQEAFASYFPDQGDIEDTMWKGLLFTAVGLGALASVVAIR